MNYRVISRKYRPQRFDEIIGQAHICTTLQNAIGNNRIAHAYLFTGSRGIGKTSTARILAKAVNCLKPAQRNPCNECQNCIEITGSRSLDVVEIDGASNRGIDQIRELRESIKYPPTNSHYRIYIIDEVHMLTKEAFNALLKTLEEPPTHALFILATTEPLKVPATIISRCQRYDFHRITVPEIVRQLKKIIVAEQFQIDDDVLTLIAKKSDGALRDAESMLEQLLTLSEGKLTIRDVQQLLGQIDYDALFKIAELIYAHDLNQLLQACEEIFQKGINLGEFIGCFSEHFRNLLIARISGSVEILDLPPAIGERYLAFAENWSVNDLLRLHRLINEAQTGLKSALNQRTHLEFLLLKMGAMDKTIDIRQLLSGIKGGTTSTAFKVPQKNPPLRSLFDENTTSNSRPNSRNAGKTAEQNPEYKPEPTRLQKPPTDKGSIDAISSDWETIMLKVEENNTSLGEFLRAGKLLRLSGNILEIGFDPEKEYHRKNIASRANVIEKILNEMYQKNFKIRCIETKDDSSQPKVRKPIDQLTEKVVDLLDGEIIIK